MGKQSNRNGKHENEDNQNHIDPIFGQAKVFGVDDPLVNPLVIDYLKEVRREALQTNAISVDKIQNTKVNYVASIYDDEDLPGSTESENVSDNKKPTLGSHGVNNNQLAHYQYSIDNWLKWFNNLSQKVREECYVFEGYDEATLNHLLDLIKSHLTEKLNTKKISGFERHLLNILRDQHKQQDQNNKDTDFSIDEEWLYGVLNKMKAQKVRNLNEVKQFIQNSHTSAPMGMKDWYKYVMQNEPTHTTFVNMIDPNSLWTLVDYMTQEWLKDINKATVGTPKRNQLSKWLLYLLVHIPTQLTADKTSKIRDLGKKSKKLLDARKETNIFGAEDSIVLPEELEELEMQPPPKTLDLVSLVLIVVAEIHGQRDLLEL